MIMRRIDTLMPVFSIKLFKEYGGEYELIEQRLHHFINGLYTLNNLISIGSYIQEENRFFHNYLMSFYRIVIKQRPVFFHISPAGNINPYTCTFEFVHNLMYKACDKEHREHLLFDLFPLYLKCKYVTNSWKIALPMVPITLTVNSDLVAKIVTSQNRKIAFKTVSAWAEENGLKRPISWSYNEERTEIYFDRMCVNDIEYLNLKNKSRRYVSKYISLIIQYAQSFMQAVDNVCDIYKIDIAKSIVKVEQNDEKYNRIEIEDEDSKENVKYETLKSTYRRAAVMELIDKSGLCKDIDKTKKAQFVEAVTGGNINARPKDTVSYKTPTKEAREEAKKLLEKIGVNI